MSGRGWRWVYIRGTLHANTAYCGTCIDGVQEEVELSPGWFGGGGKQCSSEAVMGNVCDFCLWSLNKVVIVCSKCSKVFCSETVCVGVERKRLLQFC